MELHLYWLLQISGVILLFAFNYGLLSYYTDPHESVRVTMLIQVFSLSSVLVYILLIPFDVFATVRHYETLFKITTPVFGYELSIKIYDLYFLCYVGMIYLCFIGLPFSYFYAQSVQEEDDMLIQEQANLYANQKKQDEATQPDTQMAEKNTEDTPESSQEKTYKFSMKGMDSSDDSADEEDAEKATKKRQDEDQPSESDQLLSKEKPAIASDIKSSTKRSSWEKFVGHSKKAFKKTVNSFICLSVMMLISFVISTYEINQLEHIQLEQAQQTQIQSLNLTNGIQQPNEVEQIETSYQSTTQKKPKTKKHKKKNKHGKRHHHHEDEDEDDNTADEEHDVVSRNYKQKIQDKFNQIKQNVAHVNATEVLSKTGEHLGHFVDTVKTVNYTALADLKTYEPWKKQVLDSTQYGEPFLRFFLTAIISTGALLKLIYLSYGMAGLPMYLIKGTKSLESENTEIQGTIQQVREKLRTLQEKYARSQRMQISAKDKLALQKLRREEKLLNNKQMKINSHIQSNEADNNTCWQVISVILKLLTPFRVAIGAACLALSIMIIYSLMINNIDRFFHSECGFKCGYLLNKSPVYFNPIDQLLLRLSSHHEKYFDVHLFLDTTLFATMLVYVFICTLYGIIKIGINFFGVELWRIRKRDTTPQALSVVSILVILMMFAFSMSLISIAPQYLTFGDQRLPSSDANVKGADLQRCTLAMSQLTHLVRDENGNLHETGFGCQMTMIAQLYNKIQLSLPLFSMIYFFLSVGFTTFFILFTFYHGYYKRNLQSQYLGQGYEQGQEEDDDDDDQDDDLQNFIQEKLSQAASAASTTSASLAEKIKNDRWEQREEDRCWDNQSALSMN